MLRTKTISPSAQDSVPSKAVTVPFGAALLAFALALPATGIAAPAKGWTDNVRSDAIQGCTNALKETVMKQARQQAGLKASDPLPADMSNAVEQQYMPEFQKTCACTIDRVAEKHSYKDVQDNPELLRKEAERVGSPQGCPLNV